jgi:hypothetical protein
MSTNTLHYDNRCGFCRTDQKHTLTEHLEIIKGWVREEQRRQRSAPQPLSQMQVRRR